MQRDRALGDAQARLLLELGAPLHPVGASLIGHICLMNLDIRVGRRYIFARHYCPTKVRRGHADHRPSREDRRPQDAKEGFLGGIGVRFMIDGSEAGERFSLVEHPMAPRALAAPLHRHTREDEYSFVLEGRMGALLGDDVVEAGPGDLVYKPRNQWHTFWNAGDEPCRILEIISPAGFEHFFEELVDARRPRRGGPRGARAAQRALRPRDAAGDAARAARALRPADGRAARRRLDARRRASRRRAACSPGCAGA